MAYSRNVAAFPCQSALNTCFVFLIIKTYKEIAEEKGISVKTVEAQMGIALKRIREKMLSSYKEGGDIFVFLLTLL